MGQALKNDLGYHRIYVCGRKAYDNELAMYRHEGVSRSLSCVAEPVFDAHPKIAYRIEHNGTTRWVTDLVDVVRLRAHAPDAHVAIVPVLR